MSEYIDYMRKLGTVTEVFQKAGSTVDLTRINLNHDDIIRYLVRALHQQTFFNLELLHRLDRMEKDLNKVAIQQREKNNESI
tara:strand:- start:121 stop:366 length:246 start_codon:yes stop_codon:yes gene_type:complete